MKNEITLNQCHIPEMPKLVCSRGGDITYEKCMICGNGFELSLGKGVSCVYDNNDHNKVVGHICMECYEYISDEESE